MKTLVIGGTGFLGLNLVKALKEDGHEVSSTKRASSNTLFLRQFRPRLIEADCEDRESLRRAAEGQDAVFMCAAHYPRYSVSLAEQVAYGRKCVRNVLAAVREAKVKRFIYTSSSSTLNPPARLKPLSWLQWKSSVYYQLKAAMEREVLDAIGKGLDGTVLCPSACIGPFDVKAGTGGILVGMLNGILPYYVDGMIDVVDVGDLARVQVAALKKGGLKPRYAVSHHPVRLKDFLELAHRRYGGTMPRRIPMAVGVPFVHFTERRYARKNQRVPFPAEFVDMLALGVGGDPKETWEDLYRYDTPLEQTLQKAYDWYRRYKYIKEENHAANQQGGIAG